MLVSRLTYVGIYPIQIPSGDMRAERLKLHGLFNRLQNKEKVIIFFKIFFVLSSVTFVSTFCQYHVVSF